MTSFSSRGMPPKRSEVRRRTNKVTVNDDGSQKAARGVEPQWPDPPGDLDDPDDRTRWHPYAEQWYFALQDSGQEIFYEQSDIALAVITADQLSRLIKPQFVGMQEVWNAEAEQMERKPAYAVRHTSGTDLSAILKAMTSLLVTEVDRRRAHIELETGAAATDEATLAEQEAAVLSLIRGGATG